MPKVLTPELVEAIVAVLAILATAFFPELSEQIKTLASAIVAVLLTLIAAQTVNRVSTAYFAARVQIATIEAQAAQSARNTGRE